MNIAILLAAGSSTRAGTDKLWADVFGRPLWTLAYETLLANPEVDKIIVVVRAGEVEHFRPYLREGSVLALGGSTRMESFKAGLAAASPHEDDLILDVNAASPRITFAEISAVIGSARAHGAAAVCHEVVDTLVELPSAQSSTPENSESSYCYNVTIRRREDFRLMQTPQAARGDILQNLTLDDSTDLTTALLSQGQHVELLPAHPLNKKITTAQDIDALRVHTYLGEDSHRFSDSGQLTLGGLTVPDCPALLANSDGDVILHALGRALAQAQNRSFSETSDALCKQGQRQSEAYLAPLLDGLTITHVSLSLEGARPRIDPLTPALKSSLAALLKTDESAVHVSAHTGEDLSAFGRGEGIRCTALIQCL